MVKTSIPSELRPEQVVAVIDSREQLPLDLAPLQTVRQEKHKALELPRAFGTRQRLACNRLRRCLLYR